MDALPVVVTIAFCGVYLLLRHPYGRLPLHIDTGFYVSNHTIVHRRINFARGWNARFAGGGKILPEFFYSLVYLRCGADKYASRSRLWLSIYNFSTAVVVGVLAWKLSGGDLVWYYCGLVAYALLSSEPQYGGYHESGEQFEVLPQALAVLCLFVGLANGSWWLCCLAAFLWAAETFAIKLTSAAGFVVLFGLACWSQPWAIVPFICGGALALAAYVGWLAALGTRFGDLFAAMWGLQSQQSGQFDLGTWLHRVREKSRRVVTTLVRQPVIPLLIGCGVAAGGVSHVIIWWYLAATAVIFASQGADIRYYLLVLWPPMALLAASGAATLQELPIVGPAVLVALAAAWLGLNTVRAKRSDTRSLNRWSWRGALTDAACDRNLNLASCADELRGAARGRSLLVYGPYNQAYVLAAASYDTPLISAAHWLDQMAPGWQQPLAETIAAQPPDLILDTNRCFAAATVRGELGLDYALQRVFSGGYRLYALCDRRPIDQESPATCRTHAPQPRANLALEELRMALVAACAGQTAIPRTAVYAGAERASEVREMVRLANAELALCTYDSQELLTAATSVDMVALLESPPPSWMGRLHEAWGDRLVYAPGMYADSGVDEDHDAVALTSVLESLAATGHQRIGVYGAGRKATSLIDVLQTSPATVAAIFDDDELRHGHGLAGWTIRPLADATELGVDAIVVCSDRFERPMLQRCTRFEEAGVTVVSLWSKVPTPRPPAESPAIGPVNGDTAAPAKQTAAR